MLTNNYFTVVVEFMQIDAMLEEYDGQVKNNGKISGYFVSINCPTGSIKNKYNDKLIFKRVFELEAEADNYARTIVLSRPTVDDLITNEKFMYEDEYHDWVSNTFNPEPYGVGWCSPHGVGSYTHDVVLHRAITVDNNMTMTVWIDGAPLSEKTRTFDTPQHMAMFIRNKFKPVGQGWKDNIWEMYIPTSIPLSVLYDIQYYCMYLGIDVMVQDIEDELCVPMIAENITQVLDVLLANNR